MTTPSDGHYENTTAESTGAETDNLRHVDVDGPQRRGTADVAPTARGVGLRRRRGLRLSRAARVATVVAVTVAAVGAAVAPVGATDGDGYQTNWVGSIDATFLGVSLRTYDPADFASVTSLSTVLTDAWTTQIAPRICPSIDTHTPPGFEFDCAPPAPGELRAKVIYTTTPGLDDDEQSTLHLRYLAPGLALEYDQRAFPYTVVTVSADMELDVDIQFPRVIDGSPDAHDYEDPQYLNVTLAKLAFTNVNPGSNNVLLHIFDPSALPDLADQIANQTEDLTTAFTTELNSDNVLLQKLAYKLAGSTLVPKTPAGTTNADRFAVHVDATPVGLVLKLTQDALPNPDACYAPPRQVSDGNTFSVVCPNAPPTSSQHAEWDLYTSIIPDDFGAYHYQLDSTSTGHANVSEPVSWYVCGRNAWGSACSTPRTAQPGTPSATTGGQAPPPTRPPHNVLTCKQMSQATTSHTGNQNTNQLPHTDPIYQHQCDPKLPVD